MQTSVHNSDISKHNSYIPGKMVYNWEGKRDTCYNMYITENKGLEEIQAFYRDQGFNPR